MCGQAVTSIPNTSSTSTKVYDPAMFKQYNYCAACRMTYINCECDLHPKSEK